MTTNNNFGLTHGYFTASTQVQYFDIKPDIKHTINSHLDKIASKIKGNIMSEETRKILESWLELRKLSQSEVQERFSIPDHIIEENSQYENLTNLTKLPITNGNFYFQNGKFKLLYAGMIHRSIPQFTKAALLEYFGEPAAILPSRAGRGHRQYIFPEQGIAFSAGVSEVDFIEIFNPMTLEEYKIEIYKEVGKFVR